MIVRRFKKAIWTLLFIFVWTQPAFALPSGQQVIEGTATFEQIDENTLNITASDHSIIEYESFNIAENEIVNFLLPDASSLSLNRILGVGATDILGSLTANGGIVLVNTNGFYFGANALVDVQGAILSAHDIANADFLAGHYIFSGLGDVESPGHSSILNEGKILTYNEGFAILIADAIENRGTVEAHLGHVALAGGDVVTVDISGDGLISVGVDEATARQILDRDGNVVTDQIKNTGTLASDGGKVSLHAQALDDLFEKTINTEGIIRANQVEVGRDGSIEFHVDGADVLNAGLMESDTGSIVIEANDESIENIGTIRTRHFEERAYTFETSGTIEGGGAFYDNLDGAATISGNIGSDQTDTGNIIVNGAVTLTADNLVFTADSDNDGNGVFYMSGQSINGVSGRNLTLVSGALGDIEVPLNGGESPTLGAFTNLGVLTLNASTGSTPVYTSTVNISSITNLSIGSGVTFNLNTFNIDLTAANTIINNGTIRLQGTESFGGNFGNDVTSGTWEYVGSNLGNNNNINDFGANDYFNLIINDGNLAPDNFLLASDLTVAGALTLSSGNLDANGNAVTVTGLFSQAAGQYDVGSGLHTLNGGFTITGGTFNGSGGGNIDINGDLTINNGGAAFTASSNTTFISGDMTLSAGTFSHNLATVNLDGGDQTVTGNITFSTLNKTVGSTQTLTFGAGSAIGVISQMILQGADASNYLQLRSSSPGTTYSIDPQNFRTVQFLDVQDADNINAGQIDCSTNCGDRGNNTNWDFAFVFPPSGGGGGGSGSGSSSASSSSSVREESTRVVDLINQGALPSSGPSGEPLEITISEEGIVAKPVRARKAFTNSDDDSVTFSSESEDSDGNADSKNQAQKDDSSASDDSGGPDPKGKDSQSKEKRVKERKDTDNFHWNFHDVELARTGKTTVIVIEGAVYVQKVNEQGEILGEGVYVRENEKTEGVGIGGVPESTEKLNLEILQQAVGDRSTKIKGLVDALNEKASEE